MVCATLLSACGGGPPSAPPAGNDELALPPESPVCDDADDDIEAFLGSSTLSGGEPAKNPPAHGELTHATLGLDEAGLKLALDFAGPTPGVGERVPHDIVAVQLDLFVDGRPAYQLFAERDVEGAYEVFIRPRSGTEADAAAGPLSIARQDYSIDGSTLTLLASTESLEGLDREVHWRVIVTTYDTGDSEQARRQGAAAAVATSKDHCPDLEGNDEAIIFMGQTVDGTPQPAPQAVLDKLPKGPPAP